MTYIGLFGGETLCQRPPVVPSKTVLRPFTCFLLLIHLASFTTEHPSIVYFPSLYLASQSGTHLPLVLNYTPISHRRVTPLGRLGQVFHCAVLAGCPMVHFSRLVNGVLVSTYTLRSS